LGQLLISYQVSPQRTNGKTFEKVYTKDGANVIFVGAFYRKNQSEADLYELGKSVSSKGFGTLKYSREMSFYNARRRDFNYGAALRQKSDHLLVIVKNTDNQESFAPFCLIGYGAGSDVIRESVTQFDTNRRPNAVVVISPLADQLLDMKTTKRYKTAINSNIPPFIRYSAIKKTFIAPDNPLPKTLKLNWNRTFSRDRFWVRDSTTMTKWEPDLQIPVLIVMGAQNQMFNKSDVKKSIDLQGILDVKYVEIDQAGQAVLLEQPDKTRDAVLPFLEEHCR